MHDNYGGSMSAVSRHRITALGAGVLLAVGLACISIPAASAAPARPAAAAHAAAPARAGGLQADLEALGLSVQLDNGYIGATGPAFLISLACTTLGTGLGYGAVAFYTGHNETGEGGIEFIGDSVPAKTWFGLTGAVVDNFENCTNQTWSASNFVTSFTLPITGITTDGTDAPGADENIAPTGDSLIEVGAAVDDVLNNLDVSVLSE
jgi:hypothetical protein